MDKIKQEIEAKLEKLQQDLAVLQQRRIELSKAMDKTVADINATSGGIQTCNQLLMPVATLAPPDAPKKKVAKA